MTILSPTPKVSIVMAAYNASETIERAIRSIQNQTYPDWDLWVVDDGSVDNTADMVNQLVLTDVRIHLLQQPNGGTAAARNLGLAHCESELIAFLDSDDRWLPQKLLVEIDTLRAQSNPVGVVYSWYYAVDENDHLVTMSPAYTLSGLVFHDVLTRESLLLPSTTLMHRQILDTCGQFLQEHIHEDREFYLRVCKQFPIYPSKHRLVLYQQTASGKCRALLNDFDKAVHAELSIVDAVAHLLSPEDVEALTVFQKRNLFYRFLMYNHVHKAQVLQQALPTSLLIKDRKGCLAWFSMKTGINVLAGARLLVQGSFKWLLHPWWRQKIQRLLSPSC